MESEWDEDKARSNFQKHGVTFAEAETVFDNPLADTFFDPNHSDDEDRYLTIGESARGRLSSSRTPTAAAWSASSAHV